MCAAKEKPRMIISLVKSSTSELISTLHVALLVVLLTGIIAVRRKRNGTNRKQPWPKIPGGMVFIGQLFNVGGNKMVSKMEEWAKTYGSGCGVYEYSLMGKRYIVACREDAVLEIMKQRPYLVQRGVNMTESVKSYAPGVFAAEGDIWKRDRRVFAPAFNQQNLASYLPSVKVVVTRLVHKWYTQAKRSNIITVNEDFNRFTCDTIALIVFNVDFDTLNDNESVLSSDLNKVMTKYALPRALSPLPYWKIPIVGQYLDGAGWAISRLQREIGKLIDDYESTVGDDKSTSPNTLLGKMVMLNRSFKGTTETKSDDANLSRERLVGNIMTTFLAGTDTSASTLSFCMWYIASNSTGLQEELLAETKSLNKTLEDITLEDLFHHVPRIRSFVKEVLRVSGPSNWLMLENVTGPAKLAGAEIEPRSALIITLTRFINTHPAGTSSCLLVPSLPKSDERNQSPQEFNPHRWIDVDNEGKANLLPSARTVMPFGYGHRICPGRDLAEAEVLILVVELLKTFHISLEEGHPDVGEITQFTNHPDKDVRLVLVPRFSLR